MAKIQKVLIINAATGVEELRDINAEELAQWELDKAAQVEKEAAKTAYDIANKEQMLKKGAKNF
jgi:hypothetical protein